MYGLLIPICPEKILFFIRQNVYGYKFFCVRLRISSCTVTNFFLYGCGCHRNRREIYFCTVTDLFVTVRVV